MTIAPAPTDRIEVVTSDPRGPVAFAVEAYTEGKTAFIEALLARR